MNKYLNEIKANETKMAELKARADKLVLEYKQKVADVRYAIGQDNDLSPSGKARKSAEAAQEIAKEFTKATQALNREYVQLAVSNGVKAEFALVEAKPEPADATKQALYEAAKADLQTRLLFATNSASAMQQLATFTETYSAEPAFAADIAANFGQLAGHVISATPTDQQPQLKHRMQDMYSDIQRASKTQSQLEAEAALSRSKADQQAKLFGHAAIQAANAMFGPRVASSVNSIVEPVEEE